MTVIDTGQPSWVAGFMTGTSVDAVDGAMILTDGEDILDLGARAERKFNAAERATIMDAVAAARAWNFDGDEPSDAFAAAEAVLRVAHLDALAMMSGGPVPALVGVHGQTVLHRRPVKGRKGATRQIFDIQGFAAAAGLPVWFDFRSADVAAGGEGAPLAPVYHRAHLKRAAIDSGVVLNLGGVANITVVTPDGEIVAFDCGPANGPIDEWVHGHDAGTHDSGGALAASGRVNAAILTEIMDHPFFDEPPPKSLDRFDFSANLVRGLTLEDGAATLVEIAALGVARGIALTGARPDRIVACGGGRHNPSLMVALNRVCACPVVPAETLGWRGDSIEAEAFAFLAARAARGLPISFPATTGVPEPMTGGRLKRP